MPPGAEGANVAGRLKIGEELRQVRVLITGARGNLGAKLHHHLTGRYELVLTSHHSDGDSRIHAADLRVWDPGWVSLFARVDVVVHLAANPNRRATWPELVAPNIDMVLNVYEAAVVNGVSRVIFASSNHVLSSYRDSTLPVLGSSTPPRPGNAYGATKLAGERIGKHFSERHQLSSINVRIGWNRRGRNRPDPDTDDWARWMWLSNRDFCHLMERCILAPLSVKWVIMNGVSNNAGSPWDLSEARAFVGYYPQDDAFNVSCSH